MDRLTHISLLQRRYAEFMQTLFNEGTLDDQFTQLQQLQDPANPNFVAEVVTLFFGDSERILAELTRALEQQAIDFKQMDAYVHQLKGSSSSIGAPRMKNVCVNFRAYCENKHIEGCWQSLHQLKHEFFVVKSRLEALLQLEQQILSAGGDVPYYLE